MKKCLTIRRHLHLPTKMDGRLVTIQRPFTESISIIKLLIKSYDFKVLIRKKLPTTSGPFALDFVSFEFPAFYKRNDMRQNISPFLAF